MQSEIGSVLKPMGTESVLAGLIDLIFPPKCIECGALVTSDTAVPICEECFAEITFIESPLCLCCGLPFKAETAGDHLCGECITSKQYFSLARAVGIYDKVLLEAVHRFKYNRNITTGRALGKLMAGHAFPLFDPWRYNLIVPVPLHPKRLRQRGFNQAVILAKELANKYAFELALNFLQRSIDTLPQFNLGRAERHSNVKGAFSVFRQARIDGRNIILVDDIFTTGNTVRECARVLLEAGAKEVAVLTLARAL